MSDRAVFLLSAFTGSPQRHHGSKAGSEDEITEVSIRKFLLKLDDTSQFDFNLNNFYYKEVWLTADWISD